MKAPRHVLWSGITNKSTCNFTIYSNDIVWRCSVRYGHLHLANNLYNWSQSLHWHSTPPIDYAPSHASECVYSAYSRVKLCKKFGKAPFKSKCSIIKPIKAYITPTFSRPGLGAYSAYSSAIHPVSSSLVTRIWWRLVYTREVWGGLLESRSWAS